MTNKIKGVVFDFNGTLFFDNDKHIKAWGAISKIIRGHGISEAELHTHFNGVPNNMIIQYLFDNKATQEDLEKYSSLKEEYYRKFCFEDKERFHLVAGTTEFFDYLNKNHIPFTIASASIKANIDFFVENFHLDKWLDPNDIVYDDGTYKNKIEMFKKASSIIGVDMKDAVVLEDSESGIKNSHDVGCTNIIVINSANKKAEYQVMPGVISVIDDLTEIDYSVFE